MAILSVIGEGQMTLQESILQHMGVNAGDSVEIDLLPGGAVAIRPTIDADKLRDYFDARREDASSYFSIEEIRDAIEAAWIATD